MLNKDFQLITKGGSSRGNRGYSASSPIKIKMEKIKLVMKLVKSIYLNIVVSS